MAWHGMTWHVMAWLGMAWHGVAWLGVAWRGVAWRGVAWRGVARVAWRGVAWRGVAWHGMVWHCLTYQKMRCGFLRKETLHLREGCLLYVSIFASNQKSEAFMSTDKGYRPGSALQAMFSAYHGTA